MSSVPLTIGMIEHRMRRHLHRVEVRAVVERVLTEGLRRYCERRKEEALQIIREVNRGDRSEALRIRLVELWEEVGGSAVYELWRITKEEKHRVGGS